MRAIAGWHLIRTACTAEQVLPCAPGDGKHQTSQRIARSAPQMVDRSSETVRVLWIALLCGRAGCERLFDRLE
jgi:hypothetical protein